LDRTDSPITVFGGTGFLGRQIVRRLADGGADVRVAVRHPEQASFLAKAGTTGQITTAYADVWHEASVGPAVNGAEAVVNTVGHYVEARQGNLRGDPRPGRDARRTSVGNGGSKAARPHIGYRC
jgi:uncharacterized protein YbjT (DUF2867 family)